MTGSRANAQAALQYLIWALEDIEKAGNQKAAKHARIALKALRDGSSHRITRRSRLRHPDRRSAKVCWVNSVGSFLR